MASKLHSEAAIASAITGWSLVDDFGEVHAVIEAFAGGPVFTHQLPRFLREHEEAMRARFPELAALDIEGIKQPETRAQWMAEHEKLYRTRRHVPELVGAIRHHPLEGLDPGKTIVVRADD